MTWVRLDDQFFRHAKARAAGRDGRALYLAGLCFASANLTDGIIRSIDLPLVAAEAEVRPSTSRALVDARLWDVIEGGWQIHDWDHLNPSAEEVKERREKEREKKRRRRRGPDGQYVSPWVSPGDNPRESRGEAQGDTPGESPRESRGLSDQPTPTPTSNKSSSTNGCRASTAATTTIEAIADQRIARLANPPTSPNGYRRTVIGNIQTELGERIASLVAEHPHLEPAAIANLVEPPTPQRPPDPLDRSAAAQRARDERLAARARGEACKRCDGVGHYDIGDGTFARCDECQP